MRHYLTVTSFLLHTATYIAYCYPAHCVLLAAIPRRMAYVGHAQAAA